jgi:hypothetical protein
MLVAMAVMALSLTMLYQVDASAVRGVGDYASQQRASVLAQSLLDARQAVPAAGLSESGQAAGFDWSLSAQALPKPPGLDLAATVLHEVRVVVRWQGHAGARQLELTTLLPQARPKPGSTAP